jgi:hypothetical protein
MNENVRKNNLSNDLIIKLNKKGSRICELATQIIMHIQLFILFLVSPLTMAFLPKWPGSLQNILASRAIVTTFGERVSEELLTNSNLLQQVIVDHSRNQVNMDIFYLIMLGFVLNNARTQVNKRLSDVTWFSDMRKKTNILFLVIMIIFNRNVENAI